MITKIKTIGLLLFTALVGFTSCKKTEYALGDLKAPTNLTLTATVAGVNATNPNGDGTGNVAITVNATNALTYNIDFGNGLKQTVASGVINYKYSNPGTFEYTITVNAVGTGGIISTISKKVKVFVSFQIPTAILDALTNNASRKWVTDKEAAGHVGVGPADQFAPIWYSADPNTRAACQYDDEITFSKDASNNIFMTINTMGESFLIGAATSYYGFTGGDGCYAINTGGQKKLAFMDATSTSTAAISTRIQFIVPGNGFVNFGTGGNTYEILAASATNIHLRNIGIDGNAWYQKLKVKL